MKYNFFFNLHIPKTGGTYFRNNILAPNEKIFISNGINIPPVGGEGTDTTLHWCWYPDFTKESAYIYTNLRDPVRRIVSHYSWQAYKCVYFNKTEYGYNDISVENFYKWVEKFYDNLKNFQSKNLVYFNENPAFYKKAGPLAWENNSVPVLDHGFFKDDFKNFKIDNLSLYNNFNRINMLVKSEDLNNLDNQKKVMLKIYEELGINSNLINIESSYANENRFSSNIYNSLSETQKQELYEMSPLDSDLYFSDEKFYKF